jgi:hypothetical protein
VSGTCKDCKFWREPPTWQQPRWTQGSCQNLGEGADEMTDAEGWGGVDTGPDFGCIHFEQKQDT